MKTIEEILDNLGTVEDFSDEISENYKQKILKSFLLYQNKYNGVVDDTVCVEVNADGSYLLTNEDLPYDCYSKSDQQLLKNIFANSNFQLKENTVRSNPYYCIVDAFAKVKDLDHVESLIKEYRSCNDKYLCDKVKIIIGDDERYLDRL